MELDGDRFARPEEFEKIVGDELHRRQLAVSIRPFSGGH